MIVGELIIVLLILSLILAFVFWELYGYKKTIISGLKSYFALFVIITFVVFVITIISYVVYRLLSMLWVMEL